MLPWRAQSGVYRAERRNGNGSIISENFKSVGKYRSRIEIAFLFSVLKAILSKMPLCVAFFMLSRFYTGAITAEDCVTAAVVLCVSVLLEAFFS